MPAWTLAACSNSLAQVQLDGNANCTAWEERAPDEVRDWISLPRYPRTAPSSLTTDGLMAFPNRKYLDLRVSSRGCETSCSMIETASSIGYRGVMSVVRGKDT